MSGAHAPGLPRHRPPEAALQPPPAAVAAAHGELWEGAADPPLERERTKGPGTDLAGVRWVFDDVG